eukprot:TRINITY_DN39097_c0_g1_i1.p1 TRINITY_DN39097_c0_g1~~TRINITY_DN39097_c0_g1_i1.p1  ORF type:complete len:302 (-),score=69.62 TRINITY_DN39097_c0_g1_i1:372-1175(-)
MLRSLVGSEMCIRDSEEGEASRSRFDCAAATASETDDKTRIMTEIGEEKALLEKTVHGRVVGYGIEQALESGSFDDFVPALSSSCKELVLNLMGRSSDSFESLDKTFSTLKACERLTVWTETCQLPDSLSSLTTLLHLEIYGFEIINVDPDLGNLSALRLLALELPLVPSFPTSICGLPHLEHLNIFSEAIQNLPEELGNLVDLTELILNLPELEVPQSTPHSIGSIDSSRRSFDHGTQRLGHDRDNGVTGECVSADQAHNSPPQDG